jgi:hypothetical protein
MKLPNLIGGADTQRSLNLSDNRCVNLYPTTNDDGSIAAFYQVEGLNSEGTLSGIPTGVYKTSTNRAFYVTGTTLYELNSDYTSTSRGTVTAGNFVFSDNGLELIGVNGIDGWILTLATNELLQVKTLTDVVTISIATPSVLTSEAHGLTAGDRVQLTTNGLLPDGFDLVTTYYVLSSGLTADEFQLSLTNGGAPVAAREEGAITCTMTIADPVVVSKTAHGLIPGDVIQLQTTGALPTGLSTLTDYYVTGSHNVTFQSTPVTTSSVQSEQIPNPDYPDIDPVNPTITSYYTVYTTVNKITITTSDSAIVYGSEIMFYSNGELPTGITTGVKYYINTSTDHSGKLFVETALSAVNLLTNAVTYTSAGYGTSLTMKSDSFSLATQVADIYINRIVTSGSQSGVHTYIISSAASYGVHEFTTLSYGFPSGCKTISYMNGRFIACEPNTQNFYVSGVLDGYEWNALDVQTVDSNPDYVTCEVVSHNELIVFCEESAEIFQDSGTTPAPFVRNLSGIFEVGCKSPYSISKLDNSIFWLGNSKEGNGIIYRLNGYTPTRISTYSIEYAIKSMTDISDARSFSYQSDGHHFYVLNFPTGDKTFVFDANTNIWHERASFIDSTLGRWEADSHIFFNGVHLVSDYQSTNLYKLDSATYSNGANPLKTIRSFKSPSSEMKRVRHSRLTVEAELGVGVTSQTPTPTIMLRWSDDSHVWSNELWRSLGELGNYAGRVVFERLGITKYQQRIYELSTTAAVKVVLIGVYLE